MRLLIGTMRRGAIDPVMHLERPPVLPSTVKTTALEIPLTPRLAAIRSARTLSSGNRTHREGPVPFAV